MKFILVLFTMLFLASCSSDIEDKNEKEIQSENSETSVSENDSNLIDFESVNEGFWITYGGGQGEDEKMLHTESIPYDNEKNYSMNFDGYVSYYNDDQFLETILHIEEKPQQVQTVVEANNIVLSFKRSFDEAELIEE